MALTKIGKEGITGISNASDATFLTATSGEGVTLAGTLAVTGVHTVGTNAVATSDGGAATTSIVQGLAKVWMQCTGNGETLLDSFNQSSLTNVSAGSITVVYNANMSNGNGSVTFAHQYSASSGTGSYFENVGGSRSTENHGQQHYQNGSLADAVKYNATVHGDLA